MTNANFSPRRLRFAVRFAAALTLALFGGLGRGAFATDLSNVAITSISSGSLVFTWTIPAISTPTIVLSSNNFSTFLSSSSGAGSPNSQLGLNTTTYLATTSPQLQPDTTYWFKVKNSSEADSDYTAAISTFTLPAPPSLTGAVVFLSSITANWSSGNPASGAPLTYNIAASTSQWPNTNTSNIFANGLTALTTTFGATGVGAALLPNTTYFIEVQAVNATGAGAFNSFAAGNSTSTLAAVPNNPGFGVIGAAAIAFTWQANSNGPGTLYTAQMSTSAFPNTNSGNVSAASLPSLTTTFGTGGAGPALTGDTTYFFQVSATNNNGIGTAFSASVSTFSLPAPPSLTSPAVFFSSITTNWSSGNPASGAPLTYNVSASTSQWPNTNTSNIFVNGLSALTTTFGTTGVGAALLPNTTYFFEVQAVNATGAGAFNSFAGGNSTSTLAAVPSNPGFGVIGAAAIAFTWQANSNGPGTLYTAQMSTSAFPNTNSSNVSAASLPSLTTTFGTGGAGPALSGDTTYFFQVQAVNNNSLSTGFSAVVSTFSLPAAPALTGASAFLSSVTVNWSSGNPASGAPLTYNVVASTSQFPNGNASNIFANGLTALTTTFGTTGVGAALLPNTTYFFETQAVNATGAGAFSAPAQNSTSTLAAVPFNPGFGVIGAAAIGFTWLSNSNGPGTLYTAQMSTSAFPNSNSGNVTAANLASLTTTFGTAGAGPALTGDTTYFFQVQAINNVGLATAFTGAVSTFSLPAPPSLTGAVVFLSSITANWSSGNPASGAPLTYNIAASTSQWPNTNTSNIFANGLTALTTTFGATGVGAALLPNTTYFIEVQALNATGAGAFNSFASGNSTSTLAALPNNPGFGAIGAAAIAFTWQSNSNGPGTLYTAQVSTSAFPNTNSGNVSAANLLSLTTTFGPGGAGPALNPDTTYFFQASATNNNGIGTAFAAAVSTFSLPAAPGAGSPVFTGVQLSSVGVNWTLGTNPAAGAPLTYSATVSTSALPNANSGNFTTANLAALTTTFGMVGVGPALAPSATYFFAVQAFNATGGGAVNNAVGSTSTLAAVPNNFTFTNVTNTSATFNWGANGDGPGTLYTIQVSTAPNPTAPAGAVVTTTSTFATSVSSAGLTTATAYFFQVQATNNNNLASAFSAPSPVTPGFVVTPSSNTPPFTGVTLSSIAVAWTASGEPAGTFYNAQVSTSAFPNTNSGNFLTGNLAALTTTFGAAPGVGPALSPSTVYFFQVEATSGSFSSAFFNIGSTFTLAAVPNNPVVSGITTSSIAFSWGANGDGPATLYAAQLSTSGFPNTNSGNVTAGSLSALTTTFGPGGAGPALTSDTTYFLQVQATNGNGLSSAFLLISTFTLPAAPGAGSPAFTAVQGTSLGVQWTLGANPASGAPLTYNATISSSPLPNANTGNFTAVNLAALTTTFGAAPGAGPALVPNTTYFVQVQAFNPTGASLVTQLGSTSTLVATPNNLGLNGISTNSIAFNWGANGNAAGTLYTAQMSTNAFPNTNSGNVNVNSLTALTTTFGAGGAGPALSANTTYFFQVLATNSNGLSSPFASAGSTVTFPLAPALTAAVVNLSSITANWTNGGNPNASALSYNAVISTSQFPNGNTGNVIVNGLTPLTTTFGATGAGAPLLPNTTYFVQVQAVNATGVGAFSTPTQNSTSTLAAVPSALGYGPITAAAVAFNWGSNSNGPGTLYTAQASTSSFPNTNSGNVTASNLLALTTTFGTGGAGPALNPDTTYFFQVSATNNNNNATVFAAAPSTFTLPAAPGAGAPVFTAVQQSSVAVNWTLGTNPAAGAPLTYNATVSTGALPNANAGNFTALNLTALTTTFGAIGAGPALVPNTTYFFSVQAFNATGGGAANNALGSTSTLAALPVNLTFSNVTGTSAQFNWTASGNGPGTLYTVQTSTAANPSAPAGAVVTTSQTFGISVSSSGLTGAVPYFFQVQATNNNGLSTAFTVPVSVTPGGAALTTPTAAATTFTAVNVGSVTVAWSAAGEPAGTFFNAQISTSPTFASINATSATFNTSAVFGSGGAGPALSGNTTYFFQVQAASGIVTGAFFNLGSSVTLPAPPNGTALLSVSSNTVSLAWNYNGNSTAGTRFEVWQALDAGFATGLVKTLVSTNSASLSGLASATSFFFQVRTLGNTGFFSGFDTAVSTFTPAVPAVPGQPAFATVGNTALTWTWTAAATANTYNVVPATNSVVVIANVAIASYTQNGLQPNTTFAIQVAGVNTQGVGSLSLASNNTTYTLANPPAGSTASQIFATSATYNWTLNGNPANTLTSVDRSTYSAFTLKVTTTPGAVTSYTDTNLLACTTYYFRVQNINGNALFSAFDSVVSYMTKASTPLAPTGLTAVSQAGNRIALTWNTPFAEGIVGFNLYTDSGSGVALSTGAGAQLLASLPLGATSFITGVIATTPQVSFKLTAKHRCGVEETVGSFASAASVGALGPVSAAMGNPASGAQVATLAAPSAVRLTLLATTLAGAPVQVIYQYKSTAAVAWVSIATVTTSGGPGFSYSWDISGNAGGAALAIGSSYNLRVVASDGNGNQDGLAGAIVFTVISGAGPTLPVGSSLETAATDGSLTAIKSIDTTLAPAVLTASAGGGLPPVSMNIATGTFPNSPLGVTVTLVANPPDTSLPPTPASLRDSAGTGTPNTNKVPGMKVNGKAVDNATGFSAQPANGVPVNIAFQYTDTKTPGVIDGTNVSVGTLKCFSAVTATNSWTNDLVAVVNQSVNPKTVTCATPHFTFFTVFGVGPGLAADLSAVRVYPVPWKPNGTDPSEGRPFLFGTPNTGIIFDTLPANVTIKIYTVSGNLVTKFTLSGGSGALAWDGRNDAGRDVASGGYFAVISSPGVKNSIVRLAIVR